ncbi:MAG: bifunctional 5,10-methylenetetrahydrofolate dehydrogenase/5,10-methenyltetrahydrofolate cyclohydrolase [Bacteroidia bacterium]
MNLIDGKKTAAEIKQEIATEVQRMKNSGLKTPHLAAILIGEDGASLTYVESKVKTCKELGFNSTLIKKDSNISEEELLKTIDQLNKNADIDGFIIQLPLPAHISVDKVTLAIDARKDVDGFHPLNVGRMVQNLPAYLPATPFGILQLLERYHIETSGKNCVVIGRSNIVGTPISILLSKNTNPGNCTVTLCHSRTKDLNKIIKNADIIIAALGKPGFIKAEMVKDGVVIIDVGITRIEDRSKKSGYRISGDVDFENVAPKCSYITPVPGGVGPMTIIGLLQNTLKAARKEIYN